MGSRSGSRGPLSSTAAVDVMRAFDVVQRHDPTGPVRPGRGETLATLRVLARDGELTHVIDDVFLPADVADRRSSRARALAEFVPPTSVVGGESAAWIWGGPLMPRVTVLVQKGVTHRRLRSCVDVCQQVRLRPDQVRSLPIDDARRLLVTTPERTALDLFILDRPSPALDWLMDLLVVPGDLLALLDSMIRTPGVAAARQRLESGEFRSR